MRVLYKIKSNEIVCRFNRHHSAGNVAAGMSLSFQHSLEWL